MEITTEERQQSFGDKLLIASIVVALSTCVVGGLVLACVSF